MYLDQWGKDNASSGQSCANVVSLSGTNLAWQNTWTWQGGSGVKSYTNINLNANLNKQLSAIQNIDVFAEFHPVHGIRPDKSDLGRVVMVPDNLGFNCRQRSI